MKLIVERGVFQDNDATLVNSAVDLGWKIHEWKDEWKETNVPEFGDDHVLFHGDLNNVHHIYKYTSWYPGVFYHPQYFHFSFYQPFISKLALTTTFYLTTVDEFVKIAKNKSMSLYDSIFVRPDGSLKQFAGRVISRDKISLDALDYGFYYDDINLPIIFSIAKHLHSETRIIMVNGKPMAGANYEDRTLVNISLEEDAIEFAEYVGMHLVALNPIYVLDICKDEDDLLKVVEVNPFSGADISGMCTPEVLKEIEEIL